MLMVPMGVGGRLQEEKRLRNEESRESLGTKGRGMLEVVGDEEDSRIFFLSTAFTS